MYYCFVLIYCFNISCLVCVLAVGSSFVWFTPLISRLEAGDPIKLTTEESSWIMSSIEWGALISCIPTALAIDKYGRKPFLLMNIPVMISSWVVLITTRSIAGLYVVRLLHGIAVGILFTVGPVYLAEISGPKIRGVICGSFQTLWNLGYLYSYSIGPYLSYNNYAYACSAVTVLYTVIIFFVPESPYYYTLTGRRERAEKTLSWLRGGNDVTAEMDDIMDSVSKRNKGIWFHTKELFTDPVERRSLLIVTSVCFMKYMSGLTPVVIYMTHTLSSVIPSMNADLITISIGVVMVFAAMASSYASDALGRRPLILFSMFGCIFFNLTNAIFYYLVKIKLPQIERFTWISYTSLIGYTITCGVGVSPLLQTLQGELFSSEKRAAGGGIINVFSDIFIFITIKQFESLTHAEGDYLNFLTFAIFSLLGSIVIWNFFNETAGKTLEEIQTCNRDNLKNNT